VDTLFRLDATPEPHAHPKPHGQARPHVAREPPAEPAAPGDPEPNAEPAAPGDPEPNAEPAAPAAAARRQRRSSKGIAPGDVVEVDRRGRRFFALVTSIHQRPSGHHDLDLRPLDPRTTYFTATIREVVAVWRRAA
jgi:pyruvate/2-oxoglutarate dehydrogenase complex dihydrolipoamide acyltransferase (E2) component